MFSNNAVMVIGPTPPGTGVIALAFRETSLKSTSPTKRYPFDTPGSSILFIPTSITTTTADPEIYIVVFDDGIIRVLNAYVSTGSVIISYYLGNLEIYLYSASPIDFQAVSLGKFSLVKKV